jgi:hypothetical protein
MLGAGEPSAREESKTRLSLRRGWIVAAGILRLYHDLEHIWHSSQREWKAAILFSFLWKNLVVTAR